MMIKLTDLHGKVFASAYSGNFRSGMSDRWEWMVERVAERFGCDPDDINIGEDDDGDELLTVKSEPVARIDRSYGLVAAS